MLLIPCPYCGNRPETEFSYGGQAHIARPPAPAELDDEEWSSYLYARDNARGPHRERWRHLHGCGRFFNLVRDTRSDRILTSYRLDEPRPGIEPA